MKTFKKIWAGLAVMLFLAVFVMLNRSTLAASTPPAQITVGQTTYTANWVDRSNVKIDATNKSTGKTVSSVLTDGTWDSNWEYTVSDPPSWSTCGSMKMNGFGSAIVGMTSRSGRGDWGSSDSYGNLTVEDGSCSNIIDSQQIKIGQWQNAGISFKATASDTINVIDPAQSLTFSNPRLQSDGTVRYYLDGQLGDTCQDIIVVNFSKKTDPNFPVSSMEYFNQKTDGSYQSPLSPNCKLAYIASHPPQHGSADNATISYYSFPLENFSTLQEPTSTQDGNGSGGSGGGGGGSGSGASCESSGSTGLEWILCPVLRIFDSMINTFTGIIENLLDFDVSTYLNPQVKNSWDIIKNIASALLIIIMLIAIIAQAVGGGPIDAYTLRKVLPRLVIAVILIQISWYMLIWIINVADDVGYGVRDLITAPFGGWGNLDLNHLIAPLGDKGQITTLALFTGLVAAVWISGITIGGVALLGLSAVASDLLAFVFLLLRQVFIILSVIVFPIALIAWILPGTQRYWKLWWDNFIKLLFLFPMIMALIYGGRIFAHIFILANTGTTIGKVISLFVLFIGFFGPYWFIPKAFKWGGQLYASASTGAFKATQGIRDFPSKYGLERAKENRQQRATLRAARLAENPNNRKFSDRLFAGEFNYARQRGRGGKLGAREMGFAKTLAEGEKATRESVPAQLLRSGYESWRHGPAVNARGERIRKGEAGYEINKLDANQAWLEGRSYADIAPDAALSGHAFDTLTTLGDPDRLREARESGHVSEEVWSKAVARNFPKLNEIARYLTLAPDLSNLSPRQFTTQDDDTAQELLRQVTDEHPYIHDRETGGRTELTPAQHREQLQRAADLAAEARNPLIWSDLGQTKRQVIEGLEAAAAAAGITASNQSRVAGGGERGSRPPSTPTAGTPTATPPTPPPPSGPGPEADEGEIRIDR